MGNEASHEDITNLALRRGLFFPSAEIYSNSPSGFWDFGPVGENLRRKVIELWRKGLVEKEGFLEIYGAQILPEEVFKASGHLASFNDPIVQCKKCHSLYRADNLIQEHIGDIVPESLAIEELDVLIKKHKVPCKKCKGTDFDNVKKFNMMLKVDIGATGNHPCYLRPETCQSIFLNFERLYKNSRQNLPIGIAQVGAAFRNEIAPRNTLLRERELGQMEVEVFFNQKKINEIEGWETIKEYKLNLWLLKNKKINSVSCEDAVGKKIVSGKLIAYYLARVQQLYEKYGFPLEKMRFRELEKDERAFYAKETWDFEVETSLGWIELIACNYRGDFDLKSHSAGSKKDLKVKEENGEEFIPHVFEISAGIDRTFYCVLDNAFRKEKRGQDERIFLKLPLKLAPYLTAIFPLMKKDGLFEKGKQVFELLHEHDFETVFDEKGSIGKRYARVDEIGVPFAITIDYDTMKDETVTLRERDSMEQKRVKINELPELLWKFSLEKIEFNIKGQK